MDKATPTEMEKILRMVETFNSAGILFVPVAVKDRSGADKLIAICEDNLEQMLLESELET